MTTKLEGLADTTPAYAYAVAAGLVGLVVLLMLLSKLLEMQLEGFDPRQEEGK